MKTFEYTVPATLYWERLFGLNIPNTQSLSVIEILLLSEINKCNYIEMLEYGRRFYTSNLREETDTRLLPDEIKLQLISRHQIHTMTFPMDTRLIRWIQTQMAGGNESPPEPMATLCCHQPRSLQSVTVAYQKADFYQIVRMVFL